jgi:hypothetical protein
LQEGNAIRSGELKQGAMGEIEKAGGGADRLVLGVKVAKVIRQAPTVCSTNTAPLRWCNSVKSDCFAISAEI